MNQKLPNFVSVLSGRNTGLPTGIAMSWRGIMILPSRVVDEIFRATDDLDIAKDDKELLIERLLSS